MSKKINEDEEVVIEETPEEVELSDEIEEDVTEEVKALEKERDDYKNRYLRALADYQNLEKRVRDERQELFKIVQANVISEFFPVLDNMNQAEVFIKDAGLKMVKDNFTQVLSELGVKEIELMGKQYDPHFAEAIDTVDGEKDDLIVEVLRKGYELNGKVLRPGQVKVSKKKVSN